MDDKWFFIFLIFVVICISAPITAEKLTTKQEDPLAEQIEALGTYSAAPFSSEQKKEMVLKLIEKYNPTNNVSTNILIENP